MQQILVQPTSASRVYYARCFRRYRWSGYLQLILAAFLLLDGIFRHSRFNLIFGIYLLAYAPFSIMHWRRVRLAITLEGMTYHNGLSALYVPWQDMEYIGRISQRWYRGWEGIILQNAHWERPRWFFWPNRWSPQFIPLWSRWNGPWWDRELFDDLFFYAPWLADSDGPGGDQGDHA